MSGLVAHAGGLGWDELVLFAAPVIILVVLQIVGRRRARGDGGNDEDGPDEGEGA